ncbi:MAG: hypothetical protein BV458_12035 [Thermoplasmata archaeon M9B2D]|nr:MAG: hypothetical protein BV458_12035 [Thermoplasmata archaeon M9B2D]
MKKTMRKRHPLFNDTTRNELRDYINRILDFDIEGLLTYLEENDSWKGAREDWFVFNVCIDKLASLDIFLMYKNVFEPEKESDSKLSHLKGTIGAWVALFALLLTIMEHRIGLSKHLKRIQKQKRALQKLSEEFQDFEEYVRIMQIPLELVRYLPRSDVFYATESIRVYFDSAIDELEFLEEKLYDNASTTATIESGERNSKAILRDLEIRLRIAGFSDGAVGVMIDDHKGGTRRERAIRVRDRRRSAKKRKKESSKKKSKRIF